MIATTRPKTLSRALIGAGFALWLPTVSAALELGLPVDCVLGQDCYIQQYFDHAKGPDWADFTCGTLSYDGHDGTDFAVPTRADMVAGVPVIAVAAGTIKGIRDGIEDFAPQLAGKECGNGVVIDHGAGWESQYCHLRMGSVRVQVGQTVDAGTPLGLIGQSGMAEFPHVHLALRKDGVAIDPFAPSAAQSCHPAPRDDLWRGKISYASGGIIGAGFATQTPSFDAIKAGLDSPDRLPSHSPALVIWAYMFGARKGDVVVIDITGPKGQIIQQSVTLDKTQALLFRAAGRKAGDQPWPLGPYRGTASVIRAGRTLDARTIHLVIAP